MTGVLLVGASRGKDNREFMINVSLLAAGVTLMVFAVIYPILRWFYSSVFGTVPGEMVILTFLGVLTFFLGLFNSFISVPAQTALQERSPQEIRARVFSAFFTISNAILLLPVFFAGAIADWIGQAQAVFVIGVAVLITAGIGLRRSCGRRVEERQNVREKTGPFQTEEAEAALTAASPAPRPMLAKEQQQQARTIDKKSCPNSR